MEEKNSEKKERKMRDSGIPWIGEVPERWGMSPLKYNYNIIAGATPDSTKQSFWDGNIKWITPADYKTKDVYVSFGKRNLTSAGYKACSTHMLPKDSIVISKRAPIGSVAITTSDLCTNQGCLGLVAKNKFVNNKYFYYVLSIYDDVLNLYGSGTTFKEISANVFSNIEFPLPSVTIQNSIADFLDSKCSKIDTLIENLRARMESVKEYKKAVITEAVTKGLDKNIDLKETDSFFWHNIPKHWGFADIKYVFEIVKRIAGKEGYDVLSVTQKGLKVKDITCNEGQIAANYKGYQFVYPDDFVMNHMDLLTGWVDCSKMFGVTSPDYRVFRLQDKNKHNLRYYTYIMQCCYTNRYFYSLGQGISTLGRWRLQTSSFMNFQIPVPPKEEQQRIADYLDSKCTEIDALLQNYEDQIATLEEYKKSLIYEYVTGKKEVPAA